MVDLGKLNVFRTIILAVPISGVQQGKAVFQPRPHQNHQAVFYECFESKLMSFGLGFEHKGKQSRMDCTENDRDSKKLQEDIMIYL